MPYGVEEMTFLKEEEVFPTVTDSAGSEKFEDSSKSSVSEAPLKEEVTEANDTNVVAAGKRKLSDSSDKQAEKKVSPLFQSCLYNWFQPAPFFLYLLPGLINDGRQMAPRLTSFCFRKLINLLIVGLN